MKKTLGLVAVFAVVLALAPMAASAAPRTEYDVTFDGYCDGLHLSLPSIGLGTDSTVDGYQTGCVSGGVFGQANTGWSQGYLTVPGFGTFTVVNNDHTWTHFGLNGNEIFVLNSGTWSYGTPMAHTGVASNTPRAGAAAPAAIDDERDIAFDGYCDGMHLISPSAGLGATRTVDGYRTGCSDEGLMGALARTNNFQSTSIVTFNTFGLPVQTGIFTNHTWIHYTSDGNLIVVLNSGTWSYGTPMDSGLSSTA